MFSRRFWFFLGIGWLGTLSTFIAGYSFHAFLSQPARGTSSILREASRLRHERDMEHQRDFPEFADYYHALRTNNEAEWLAASAYVQTLEVSDIIVTRTPDKDQWVITIQDPTGRRTSFWTQQAGALGIAVPVRTITPY